MVNSVSVLIVVITNCKVELITFQLNAQPCTKDAENIHATWHYAIQYAAHKWRIMFIRPLALFWSVILQSLSESSAELWLCHSASSSNLSNPIPSPAFGVLVFYQVQISALIYPSNYMAFWCLCWWQWLWRHKGLQMLESVENTSYWTNSVG